MQKNRLFTLVETLNKAEVRELRKFLRSPFFNHRQDVIDLFQILCKHVSSGQDFPDKQTLFNTLYPGVEKYDDHKVRMCMSFLFKLIEKYLLHKEYFSKPEITNRDLAQIMRKRKLSRHFERSLKQAEKSLDEQKLRNSDYLFEKLKTEREKYNYASAQNRTEEMNLQTVTDTTDMLFITQKLRQACLALTHQKIYSTQYNLGMLEEVLAHVEKQKLLWVSSIAAYYYGYKLLTAEEDKNSLRLLLNLLLRQGEQFTAEEERGLYLLAINYCIRTYNRGIRDLEQENFTLYREGLERGYLLDAGTLSHFTYRNIVSIALILKEYEWLEKFIYDYRPKLEESRRESNFSFSLARLKYARKDYTQALELLQKADFTAPLPGLSTRMLMLKIYCDSGETDLLEAHLEAMSAYLKRKKDLGYHRENYLNTMRMVKRRLDIAEFQKEKYRQWHEELQAMKSVAEKDWLLSL